MAEVKVDGPDVSDTHTEPTSSSNVDPSTPVVGLKSAEINNKSETDNNNGIVRQKQVDTAVKFLQSEQVKSNPLDQKIQFMKRKGLTDKEIDLAVHRAGISSDVNTTMSPGVGGSGSSIYVPDRLLPTPVQGPRSTLTTVRDIFTGLIVISTATFGLYKLYKCYLEPVLYSRKEEHDRMKRIEQFLLDIGTNMRQDINELQSSLHTVNDMVTSQQTQLEIISRDLSKSNATGSDSIAMKQLDDLKSEITTLKGLLLNRKQFPAAPVSTLQPSLPSWLKEAELPTDQTTDETSTTKQQTTESETTDNSKSENGSNGTC